MTARPPINKIWLLVAAISLLLLIPRFSALGAETVTDETGLIAAVANGGEVTVGASITLSAPLEITKDTTLNLGDYILRCEYGAIVSDYVIIVDNANLTINANTYTHSQSGGISYTGPKSAIKVIPSSNGTTITINGGHIGASSYYSYEISDFAFPASLIEVENGTSVNPEVIINNGSFSVEKAVGIYDGNIFSGTGGDLTIYQGRFYIDPTSYVAEDTIIIPATDFEPMYTVYPEAATFSDTFNSILNDKKELVLNRYIPETNNDFYYFEEHLIVEYGEQGFSFHMETYDEENSTLCISLIDSETGEVIETHTIKVSFEYDKKIRDQIKGYIENLPSTEDPGYYYSLTDMELINLWMSGDETSSNLSKMFYYSGELMKYLEYKNVSIDTRMGADEAFYTARHGVTNFEYRGVIYGDTMLGASVNHIIYVADDTADSKEALLTAVQERLDNYVGEGIITVKHGGDSVYDYHIDKFDANIADYEAQLAVATEPFDILTLENNIRMEQEYKAYFIESYNSVDGENHFLKEAAGGHYFIATVNNVDHMFVVIKDSTKLSTPTYQSSDLKTDVTVTTTDGSITLDTTIEVDELNDGEEYDKVINALKPGKHKSFDIKLHQRGKDKYVTKLNNGKFQVSIPVPDDLKDNENLVVYYVDANGKKTQHTVTFKNINGIKCACFETDHFSIYTLTEAENTAVSPELGITHNIIICSILLILSLVGIKFIKNSNKNMI